MVTPDPKVQQLHDYIARSKEAGMNDEQIVSSLIQVGWPSEQARSAIDAYSQTIAGNHLPQSKKSKVATFIFFGIIVVIGIGMFIAGYVLYGVMNAERDDNSNKQVMIEDLSGKFFIDYGYPQNFDLLSVSDYDTKNYYVATTEYEGTKISVLYDADQVARIISSGEFPGASHEDRFIFSKKIIQVPERTHPEAFFDLPNSWSELDTTDIAKECDAPTENCFLERVEELAIHVLITEKDMDWSIQDNPPVVTIEKQKFKSATGSPRESTNKKGCHQLKYYLLEYNGEWHNLGGPTMCFD